MLTSMREMLRSKLAGLLFILIIISMAVWGVTDIFSGGTGGNLIKAGARGFTAQQLDQRVETYIRNYQRESGETLTREQALQRGLVDQLFAAEISRIANLGYAQSIGAEASIRAAADAVRDIEAFRDPLTGEFSTAEYRARLASMRITNRQFEADVRDDLTLATVRDAVAATLQTPDLIGKLSAAYLTESRTVSWFVMSRDALGAPAAPSEDEVRAYYDETVQAFSQPERRGVDIVSISREDFIHQAELDENTLRTYYEANIERRFSGPQTRSFTELVFNNEASAQAALGPLAGGAAPGAFTDAASVEERSALQSQIADSALAEALFAQTALTGSVFGPIDRNGLWVIARLEDITPGEPIPFEEVVEDIRQDLSSQQAERLYFDAIVKIDDLIGLGMPLDEMAAELGAPLISYAPVDERGVSADGLVFSGELRNPDLLQQAFDLVVGDQLDVIETDEQIILARVRVIEPAMTPAYEEVADLARAALEARRNAEALDEAVTAARLRLESDESTLAAEAEAIGASIETPEVGITRQNFQIGLPRSALSLVFDARAGAFVTAPGEAPDQRIILEVLSVDQADEEQLSILTPILAAQLEQSLIEDVGVAFEAEVREEIGLRTDLNGLQAYKNTLTRQQ